MIARFAVLLIALVLFSLVGCAAPAPDPYAVRCDVSYSANPYPWGSSQAREWASVYRSRCDGN